MDLTLDDEQEALRTATADWCRAHMPLEEARSRPTGLWGDLEAMGWTGMSQRMTAPSSFSRGSCAAAALNVPSGVNWRVLIW